jgi:branched-chain amino acid transport system permease protein
MNRTTLLGWAALLGSLAIVWGVDQFAVPWMLPYHTDVLIRIGFALIAVAGLALVLGFTGQFSLGHAGFMGVGAYTVAVMSRDLGTPLPVNVIGGGLAAALAGVAVGVPTLRLTGDYLAVVTLGFNFIIITFIENMPALGAAQGIAITNPETSFGWTYTFVILAIVFIRNARRSSHGRGFEAVRDNEIATRSLGIDTTRVKVTAFAVGAFWAGVAGALFAYKIGYIRATLFDYQHSIEMLAMVVLGGTGSLSGPLLSATILTALPEMLREFAAYRMVIYSVALIAMMILRPKGLLGTRELSEVVRFAFARRKLETRG